jgi:hypothetical protein
MNWEMESRSLWDAIRDVSTWNGGKNGNNMETPYNYLNLESRFIMIYLVYPYFVSISLGNPVYFLDAYRNIPAWLFFMVVSRFPLHVCCVCPHSWCSNLVVVPLWFVPNCKIGSSLKSKLFQTSNRNSGRYFQSSAEGVPLPQVIRLCCLDSQASARRGWE